MTILLDTERADVDALVPALLQASDAHVTGELSTSLPDNGAAQVFLREGRVYGVVVRDGSRTLGELLVVGGYLTREQLDYALEAQRKDLPSWRIGELLVHLGFVTAQQVQDCLGEQMTEMLGWLIAQPPTPWHLRRGSRTRWAFAPPMDVAWLLTTLGIRTATPDAEKLAALLEPEHVAHPRSQPRDVEPADREQDYVEQDYVEQLVEKGYVDAGHGQPMDDEPMDDEPAYAEPTAEKAFAERADDGMERSDALAAISALNADDEDEDPGQKGRRIMGLLFPAGGADRDGGKRGRGKRRTG